MIKANLPKDEDLRLIDLKSFNIIGSQAEADFNELAEITSRFFNCPIALVTFIDSTDQWFKGKSGTEVESNPRDLSFCSHTILKNEVFVVEDAAKDELFADNPSVADNYKFRFYAGAPIVSPGGYNLGTVCMFDTHPKTFTEQQKNSLTLLAKQAGRLLELRKKNDLIRKHAEEIITEKTKVINNVIKVHENDNREIAYNLHEKLAQEIASSLLYLKAAEHDDEQRDSFITTAKDQLQIALVNITRLSNSIIPTGADYLPAQDLMAEYAEKIASTFAFDVSIDVEKNNDKINADLVIIAIRIINEWFSMLSENLNITNVGLSLKMKDCFELTIEDNLPDLNLQKREKGLKECVLYERVIAKGGVLNITSITNGKNLLIVTLPV
jgi:signal transduction histidine kinase